MVSNGGVSGDASQDPRSAGARVVKMGRARQAELVEAIFAGVRGDAFGAAGAHDAEYVAGLRAAVAATVDFALEGIERGMDGSLPTRPVPVVALEQARRAARGGVGLETVLRRYVLGSSLLGEVIMEEADRDQSAPAPLDRRSALRGALRAQAAVLDRLLQAVTAAYGDELERTGQTPERRLYERVRGLLDGGDHAIEDAGLDYHLDGWHLGVIARGSGAREALRGVADRVDRRLLCVESGEGTLWAWIGGQRALRMQPLEQALSGLSGSVAFAVGEPARGIEGWRLTHQQAQAALVVALRRGAREGVTLTRYGDVALLATALKDELLARALIDVYVAPLADDRGGGAVLVRTLRAYLDAERSASSAAATLGVVRRTVENRLRTIEERLGRSLHPCPPEIEVALELDELTATAAAAVEPRPPEISIVG
jgi:hypothetical protein